MNYSSILAFLLLFILVISCNSDDSIENMEDMNNVPISATDFTITIEENPEPNQILGVIETNSSSDAVRFTITEQTEFGAIVVDNLTGEIKVGVSASFDFETVGTLTATVKVSDQITEEEINVTIILEDVFYENDLQLVGIENGDNLCVFTDTDFRTTIAYTNALLTGISFTGGHKNTYRVFTFDHDGTKVTKYEVDSGSGLGGGGQTGRYEFIYNTNNEVIGMDYFWYNVDGQSTSDNFIVGRDNDEIYITKVSNNETTTILLNSEGRVIRRQRPGSSVTYDYDEDGQLISEQFGNGSKIDYSYDNKRNPFPQLRPAYWDDLEVLFSGIGTFRDNGLWYSKHNLTEWRYVYTGGTATYSYEYTYNSDGYPLTKTFECEVEETTYFSYE